MSVESEAQALSQLREAWTEAQKILGMEEVGLTPAGIKATAKDIRLELDEASACLSELGDLVDVDLDHDEWFEGMDTDRLLDRMESIRKLLRARLGLS